MKSKEKAEKRWYNYWPLLVAVIFSFLNVDYSIVPTLQSRHLYYFGLQLYDLSSFIPRLSLFDVFIVASLFSAAGTLFWYWFLGWLGRSVVELASKQKVVQDAREIVAEGVELSREVDYKIIPLLNEEGYIDRLKSYIVGTVKWATAEDNKFLKRVKKFGYLAIFGLAASPEFGARLVATIISRSYGRSRSLGLACLLLGETLKNFYMVFGFWNLVFRIPEIYTQITIIALILFTGMWFVIKRLKKT